jgi:hypothetical protein
MAGEVNVVLSGHRITLSVDESAILARGLLNCVEQLRWARDREARATSEISSNNGRATAAPETPSGVAGKTDGTKPPMPPMATESEAIQQRTRALIKASIRDKGLSLREESRS